MLANNLILPELGHFALILALCFAGVQCVSVCLGWRGELTAWITLLRSAVLGQCLFLFLSLACLIIAFATNDFSVIYVAENSHSQLPWFYKLTAAWGAHEGSFLLWISLLSAWSVAVIWGDRRLPEEFRGRVGVVLGMISVGFLLFLLLTSNPFLRVLPNIPMEGGDLNPLLQDPGFIIHPPMLYMGYVGFAISFAFALAVLLQREFDTPWSQWMRPWALAAWSFLTLGIVLGSWWAYRDLGWGGWWFWDPVENASLLPWLAGTALLHSLIVVEKRNVFKQWVLLLALIAFSLSLLGTFLVRSGMLSSVHAFANDPKRGLFMLVFLMVVIGGSLFIFAKNTMRLSSSIFTPLSLLSRESFLLANNVLLVVSMLTVLLGTLYPLFFDIIGMGKISVGPPYFNFVFVPLFSLLIFLMGVGPQTQWQQTSLKNVMALLTLPAWISIFAGILAPWVILGQWSFMLSFGMGLAVWLITTTCVDLHRKIRMQPGMVLAHLGVAITVIGISVTRTSSIERDVRMSVGESVKVGSYQFTFQSLTLRQGSNYTAEQARFEIIAPGKTPRVLYPEQRIYTAQQMPVTQAAIHATLWRDLYLALGEPLGPKTWSVRIYDKPMIRWIWGGCFFMIVGGVLSALRRTSHALL